MRNSKVNCHLGKKNPKHTTTTVIAAIVVLGLLLFLSSILCCPVQSKFLLRYSRSTHDDPNNDLFNGDGIVMKNFHTVLSFFLSQNIRENVNRILCVHSVLV
jgi:hypothetical protein